MNTAPIADRDARVPPAGRIAAGWMLLAIDGLRLALPQREVRLVELVADLEAPDRGDTQAVGALRQADGSAWPAYCLDADLGVQRVVPEARRSCVFVEAGGRVLGLVCDRIWSLASDAELTVEPVPGCMTGAPSPVAGFTRHRGGIAVVLAAASLAAYLDSQRSGTHE